MDLGSVGISGMVRPLTSCHPSGPFASPGGEPRRMTGRRSLQIDLLIIEVASWLLVLDDEFANLILQPNNQDATENYLQSRRGLQAVYC